MPYKKEYTMKNASKASNTLSANVMGSMGTAAVIPKSPSNSKPTSKSKFMA